MDYDQLILFSCREQPDPVDVVLGLALSGSGTAEYASIKYAAGVPPPPYGHLNEKKQYAANVLSAHLFFVSPDDVVLRSIS